MTNGRGTSAQAVAEALAALRDAILQAVPLAGTAQFATYPGVADVGNRRFPTGQNTTILDVETQNLGTIEPRSASAKSSQIYDAWNTVRLLLVATSTLNQDVSVQVFGSDDAAAHPSHRWSIGLPQVVGEGQAISLPVNLHTSWHPFFGLTVTPLAVPIRGQVRVTAYAQRWYPPEKV